MEDRDTGGKTGKKKPIDLEQIRRLAEKGNPERDIAYIIGFNPSYFSELKHNNPEIAEALELGQAEMRCSLRRLQLEVAEEKNPQMLIHLGKTVLGQNEKLFIDQKGELKVEYEVSFGDEARPKDKDKVTEATQISGDSSQG
jgi:hypothetical protein